MSSESTIAKGDCLTIEWAETRQGRRPAREFFEDLNQQKQSRFLALFQRLADHGKIHNKEHFKKAGDLFEFKNFQTRFLGQFRPGRFLVAHGLTKKKDKLRGSDIKKALQILREHDEGKEV